MAFTRTNATANTADPSSTTITSTGLTTTTGRLMVGAVHHEGTQQTLTSVTDTASNTYTLGTEEVHSSVDQWSQGFYCLSATGNAANQVTATWASGVTYRNIEVAEYSAGDTIYLDAAYTKEVTNASSISQTVTTTGSAGLIYAAVAMYNSGDLTGGDDATKIATSGYGVHFEKITSGPGTYTMTATRTAGTTSMTMIVLAFREGAPAVGGKPAFYYAQL